MAIKPKKEKNRNRSKKSFERRGIEVKAGKYY